MVIDCFSKGARGGNGLVETSLVYTPVSSAAGSAMS